MNALRLTALLALAAALMPAVAPVHAQVQWKWRDANGRVTVSDRPPPASVPARDILQQPAGAAPVPVPARGEVAASPAAAGSAPAGDPELQARKKKAEDAAAAKKKADAEAEAAAKRAEEQRLAAARRENCERARAAMRSIDSGQRLVRTNAAGEREFLDDAQRNAEAARLRGVMAADCR